jgi:hypothetical protein
MVFILTRIDPMHIQHWAYNNYYYYIFPAFFHLPKISSYLKKNCFFIQYLSIIFSIYQNLHYLLSRTIVSHKLVWFEPGACDITYTPKHIQNPIITHINCLIFFPNFVISEKKVVFYTISVNHLLNHSHLKSFMCCVKCFPFPCLYFFVIDHKLKIYWTK